MWRREGSWASRWWRMFGECIRHCHKLTLRAGASHPRLTESTARVLLALPLDVHSRLPLPSYPPPLLCRPSRPLLPSLFPTFHRSRRSTLSARTPLSPRPQSQLTRTPTALVTGSDRYPSTARTQYPYTHSCARAHPHTDIRTSVRLRSQSRLRRLSSLPCPVLAPPLGRSLSASLSLSALAFPFPRLPAARVWCSRLPLSLSRTHTHVYRARPPLK